MDLGEDLPPCLGRAAMTSPKFWSMGGRPPGPPIAGSATDIILLLVWRSGTGYATSAEIRRVVHVLNSFVRQAAV